MEHEPKPDKMEQDSTSPTEDSMEVPDFPGLKVALDIQAKIDKTENPEEKQRLVELQEELYLSAKARDLYE